MGKQHDAGALRATQVLHCNLNVVDVERAAVLYERGLGLTTRMRSESTAGDSSPMGIDEPTHSVAWFLYDHRGGHESPAIELVEWRTPPTAGVAYEDPTAIGMQSLLFAVPSAIEATRALEAAGATSTGRQASIDDGTSIDTEVLDADGVRLELEDDLTREAPTFTGARVNCADLDESTAWYAELGWHPVGPVTEIRWERADEGAAMRRMALPTHPFELHLTAWADGPSRGRAHERGNERGLFRMALAVDDVRAAYEQAQRRARVQIGEPQYVPLPGTPLGGLWVSFFRDPNGVMVELVERSTRAR